MSDETSEDLSIQKGYEDILRYLKNCRLNCSNLDADEEEEDNYDDPLIDLIEDDGDQDQIQFEEDYGILYTSKLEEIDEIKFFKDSFERLERENPKLYLHLKKFIPNYEVFDKAMVEAIQSYRIGIE